MKTCLIVAFAALLVAPSAGIAQQLNPARTIGPFRAVGGLDAGAANGLPSPPSPKALAVRQEAAQRDDTPRVAADTGLKPRRVEQPASTRPGQSTKPLRVTDARGLPIAGAVQVGPGRVLDPKTGRVYSTVTLGEEQRIVQAREQ